MGHRWYDPQIGRFLTRDPSGAGDNPYAYCGNNPVSNLDPLGLQSTNGDGDSDDPPFSITVSSGDDFSDPVSLVGPTGSSSGGGGSPSKPAQGPSGFIESHLQHYTNDLSILAHVLIDLNSSPQAMAGNAMGQFNMGMEGLQQQQMQQQMGAAEPEDEEEPTILFHYTNEEGMNGILDSGVLFPSLKAVNPLDARYGDGQYLSDIAPGTMTPAQLSRQFITNPWQGDKFTHFVGIDTTGLNVVQGRPGVFRHSEQRFAECCAANPELWFPTMICSLRLQNGFAICCSSVLSGVLADGRGPEER